MIIDNLTLISLFLTIGVSLFLLLSGSSAGRDTSPKE